MKKQKRYLLLSVLIVSILLIITNFYTIKVLNSVRAYINGESEYSKGQKDASLYLVTYIHSGQQSYWEGFKKAIAVPMGDNIARRSLTNHLHDSITRNGFLQGRNHPNDIDDMMWLFKTFGKVRFMKEAIDIWASAEPLINKLHSFGYQLHTRLDENRLSEAEKQHATRVVSLLSSELSVKQSNFSEVLGNTARGIRVYLIIVNIIFILVLVGSIALYAIHTLNTLMRYEEALQGKIAALNASNKELQHFTHIASHDLQEPLRMVTMFMDLFKKRYGSLLDERGKSYIHYAVDGAARMKRLITDLLEYSKTGGAKMEYEPVDLQLLLNDMVIMFGHQLKGKDAGIHFNNMPTINAIPTQMVQLFQNLISNAIKYRRKEEEPWIEIAGEEKSTHWCFSVKDNGQGIPERYFERIFDLFQRLHTQDTHQGTGIGLATCKKIVERHNGKIWLTSNEGQGSEFYFTIDKQLKHSPVAPLDSFT